MSDKSSKLDEIIIAISKDDNVKFHPEKAKQQIKDLMMEIIGEDEQRPATGAQRNGTAQAIRHAHNQIRVELRQKVDNL